MNDVPNDYVWVIFVVAETSAFPNFFSIGVYATRELAVNEIKGLPRDHNYQLLRMPLRTGMLSEFLASSVHTGALKKHLPTFVTLREKSGI